MRLFLLTEPGSSSPHPSVQRHRLQTSGGSARNAGVGHNIKRNGVQIHDAPMERKHTPWSFHAVRSVNIFAYRAREISRRRYSIKYFSGVSVVVDDTETPGRLGCAAESNQTATRCANHAFVLAAHHLSYHTSLHIYNSSPGTKPIRPLAKINPTTGKAIHTVTGEKLHQKAHWMKHRMVFDLLPLFKDDEPAKKVLHTCTHTRIHVCLLTSIHTYIQHTYIHTYIYTYIHTYIHTYMHTYIHT